MNGYLSHFVAMVKGVFGINEFKAEINEKHFLQPKPVISREDFFTVMHHCQDEQEEVVQLFGFCLYLLYVTAGRNETVRTVNFEQFGEENPGLASKYYVELYAAKTGKRERYYIPVDAYDYVMRVQRARREWVGIARDKLAAKQAGPKADLEYAARRQKLIDRRETCLFTFFTDSAIRYHVSKIKNTFSKHIKDIAVFLIHNIRKMKIRAAYEQGGLEKAREVAQHHSAKTTI